jgi:hypothetical protein
VGQTSRLSRDDRQGACPTKKEMLLAGKRMGMKPKNYAWLCGRDGSRRRHHSRPERAGPPNRVGGSALKSL